MWLLLSALRFKLVEIENDRGRAEIWARGVGVRIYGHRDIESDMQIETDRDRDVVVEAAD